MFYLTTSYAFSSALWIRDYAGPCGQMHGHHYQLKVTVCASRLNQHGMVIDYHVLKQIFAPVIAPLDHCTLNELPAFKKISPTTEHLAQWCFKQLAPLVESYGLTVVKVVLCEDQHIEVCYAPDQIKD